jgi:hypothetical protein
MDNQDKKVVARHEPEDAEPGKGAPGNQVGVQLAQSIDVNDPEAIIPSGADPERDMAQIEAFAEQEEGTGISTTEGYVIDESGPSDNFAVEPEMYVEDK